MLHFLGDCEEDLLGQLMVMPAEPVEPFTLPIDELALWAGGTLVALPSEPPSALLDLHARIARGLHEATGRMAGGRLHAGRVDG